MSELDSIRQDIDKIDEALLPLLTARMDAAKRVAEYKMQNGLPVFNQEREQQILDRMSAKGGEYSDTVRMIYSSLMEASRALQHDLLGSGAALRQQINSAMGKKLKSSPIVACAGAEGAYADVAAGKIHPDGRRAFYSVFSEVFDAVKNGDADYGVVPVENSTAGSVNEVYDLILHHKMFINGGINLPVRHCLLANPDAEFSDIERVYSKDQALAQCGDFIKEHGFTPVNYTTTAAAAKMIAEKGDIRNAAIGSEYNAELYGLKILKRNIQGSSNNCTRFISISKELCIPSNANKVSLIFSLPHTEGSLYRTLGRFALHGLNLTKIESRPIVGSEFEYSFCLDFSGNVRDAGVVDLLCALSEESPLFSFLGNYSEQQ